MVPKVSAPKAFCLVCGREESEVGKLHYFPSSKIRSQLWQEKMGMLFSGDTLRNYRICNLHFTKESYLNILTWRLLRDAIPTLLPATASHLHSEASTSGLRQEATIATTEETVQLDAHPAMSCTTSSRKPKSMFRGIKNIEKSLRTIKLMSLVKSKEGHIRQLKKHCRNRKEDIRALSDLSEVIKNLFTGLSRTTKDFLIAQLRCAKRSPHGRRWTLEDKVLALALFKRNPSGYNFLKKLVALPSKRTILSLLEKVPFVTGINEHMFIHIKQCISSEKDAFVVALLFDEMDVKQHVYYDKKK